MAEQLKLTKEGYREYQKELKRLEASLDEIGRRKNSIRKGMHLEMKDEVGMEKARMEEKNLIEQIKSKREMLSTAVIIDEELSADQIDINDYVNAEMNYGDGDIEFFTFKLVGTVQADALADIREVSIQSPLGKTVYHQSEGLKASYTVNNLNIDVFVRAKAASLEELDAKVKKLGEQK